MRRITKNIDRTFFDSEKGVASKGAPKNRGDKQLSYTVIIQCSYIILIVGQS